MSAYDTRDITQSPEYRQELAAQRTFMARVYSWMTIGLLLTALVAMVVASNPAWIQTIFTTSLVWVIFIALTGLGFGFQMGQRVLPVPVAAGLFLLYSALMGVFLSVLLYVYTATSVASTLFVTAGMFGGMSVFGYVTKRDLSGVGSFLVMGMWGVVLASIVNAFLRSDPLEWLISFIGVIVFTGLAGYFTQRIKQQYAAGAEGSVAYRKFAIYGAFLLYVTFVNLFISLMQFMGKRRD